MNGTETDDLADLERMHANRTTVDGEDAELRRSPPLIEAPKRTLADECARLSKAIAVYDERKSEHRDATVALTDAKAEVDVCARAVADASNRQPELPL